MIFTKLPKCYHYLIPFSSPRAGNPYPTFAVPPHSSSLLATTHWLSVSRYDWAFHINGIIQNTASCVWLISFSIRFSRFTHVMACIGTSSPRAQIIFLGMDLLHFIYSLISSHDQMASWVVSTFCPLWTMVLGIFIDEVLGDYMSSVLLGIYLGVEWLHHWVNLFNFFRQWQTITFGAHTISHSHQQRMRVLVFPYSPPKMVIICLFGSSHSTNCEWNLNSCFLIFIGI